MKTKELIDLKHKIYSVLDKLDKLDNGLTPDKARIEIEKEFDEVLLKELDNISESKFEIKE